MASLSITKMYDASYARVVAKVRLVRRILVRRISRMTRAHNRPPECGRVNGLCIRRPLVRAESVRQREA